jgi:hypothetical protein
LNWLAQKTESFFSGYPDVGQIGAGADFGFLVTGGAQVTLNANGNSGQLSLSWAWNINQKTPEGGTGRCERMSMISPTGETF